MWLIHHPEAEAELIEAARYYEEQCPGLGGRFLDDIDIAVAVILQALERWRILEADIRRYLMPRFPFAIYYRVLPDQIRILAFKHHRRHPDYWLNRIAES